MGNHNERISMIETSNKKQNENGSERIKHIKNLEQNVNIMEKIKYMENLELNADIREKSEVGARRKRTDAETCVKDWLDLRAEAEIDSGRVGDILGIEHERRYNSRQKFAYRVAINNKDLFHKARKTIGLGSFRRLNILN